MFNISRRVNKGFTLIELLVVIAIIAILAAILFPVFAKVREKARQTSCLSNEKQIGLGFVQYIEDYDEQWPVNGGSISGGSYGEGWAGQIYPYVKSTGVFTCPDDPETPAAGTTVVSYAANANLLRSDDPAVSNKLSFDTAPAVTVELVEVTGIYSNILTANENKGNGNNILSATTYGLPNICVFGAAACGVCPFQNNPFACQGGAMTTGPMGGYPASDIAYLTPRHTGGSNFLLADGHAKWLPGTKVASGTQANYPDCNQQAIPGVPDCTGTWTDMAAGTSSTQFAVTFSPT